MISRSHRPRGVTLIEVILSIGLTVILLSALCTFFWQTARLREEAAQRIHKTQLVRQVLARMGDELRGCVGFEEIGFPTTQGEQRLVGDRRSITFLTSVLPGRHQYTFYEEDDDLPPAQHDLTLLSYRLWVDAENPDEDGEPLVGGIIRSEKKTLNQFLVNEDDPLDLRNDAWAPELGYLEFRYFDGVEWDTTWDITEGNSLPQLVQITVGFRNLTMSEYKDEDLSAFPIAEYPLGDGLEHPDRYSLIVRLDAADKFFSSRVQRVGKQLSAQLGVDVSGGGR